MWEQLLIEIPLAIIGTIGFSILFGVRASHYLPCGLNGALSWTIFRLVQYAGGTVPVATFVAGVALTTMSRILAVHYRAPTVIFFYGGIFTLVPGAGIYGIACSLFLGFTPEGIMSGTDTVKTAVAVALGVGVAYMIPAKLFGWGRVSAQEARVKEKG